MKKWKAEPEKSILKDQHDFLQKFFTSSKKGEFSEQLPEVEQIDLTKLVILIAEDDPTNYMYLLKFCSSNLSVKMNNRTLKNNP